MSISSPCRATDVRAEVCPSIAGSPLRRHCDLVVDLAIEQPEIAGMAADISEVGGLIDDAPAATALIRKALDPTDAGQRPSQPADYAGQCPAFAVPGCLIRQPHTIEFEVLVDAGVGDDMLDPAWVEGITQLQHAEPLASDPYAEMDIAVVDHPAGVVVRPDHPARFVARDQGHVERGRAEA